jgi:hypothetical protein
VVLEHAGHGAEAHSASCAKSEGTEREVAHACNTSKQASKKALECAATTLPDVHLGLALDLPMRGELD